MARPYDEGKTDFAGDTEALPFKYRPVLEGNKFFHYYCPWHTAIQIPQMWWPRFLLFFNWVIILKQPM